MIWLTDEGMSARSLARPALQEALAMLRDGHADALVVSKLDRLSRSVQDFAGLLALARKQRWAVNALDVGVDTTTSGGELVANVMASVAQWERRVIGERTSLALQAAQARGVRVGRPRSLSKEAEQRVFELRALGLSVRPGRRAAERGSCAHRARRQGVARNDRLPHPRAHGGGPLMAHVREVERKTGRAYEVRWRDGGKFRQRSFTLSASRAVRSDGGEPEGTRPGNRAVGGAKQEL